MYNSNASYSGFDPFLVGKRENFMIRSVSVDAVKDANGFTGAFQIFLKFNYGGDTPSGTGRTVWLTSTTENPVALQTGSTQITFNGLCTDTNNGCNVPEYTVTINMNGSAVQGSNWYTYLQRNDHSVLHRIDLRQ